MPKSKQRKKPSLCRIEFIPASEGGPAVMLYDRDGYALRAMNYARGTTAATARARARRNLLPLCAELSAQRRRSR